MAKILLVDDEPDLLAAMAEALNSASHDVTPVSDSRLVLANYTGLEFDLVVNDIIMPGVEGLEILKHLRRQNPNFKAVVISGGGRIEPSFHLRLAKQLGASETLKKPFRLKALVEAVERALEDGNEPRDRTSERREQPVDIEEQDRASADLLSLTITSL